MAETLNRPPPTFSVDPVVDFCVNEAIAEQVGAARKKATKKRQMDAWKAQGQGAESSG